MSKLFGFDLGIDAPALGTWSGIGMWITMAAIVLIVSLSICILIWMWHRNKTFNKKIEIYENIAGSGWQLTGRDRARTIKVGDGGEELLYLMKKKVYRTAYGKKMGKNTYWFAVGQDGYWYNVVLGDLDAKMGMLDIEPIDRDMRYMHVAIRKNIQERYRKIGLMEKYGTLAVSFFSMVVILIGMWFLIAKIGDLVGAATQAVNAAGPVADALNNAVGKLDSLCSGGSGIRPA